MRKKELYDKVIAYFEQAMPVAETELNYSNPFELLIAVILSAQCTDKRVNMITPPLFHDFPTIETIDISLFKENPPMGACAQRVGVEAHYMR